MRTSAQWSWEAHRLKAPGRGLALLLVGLAVTPTRLKADPWLTYYRDLGPDQRVRTHQVDVGSERRRNGWVEGRARIRLDEGLTTRRPWTFPVQVRCQPPQIREQLSNLSQLYQLRGQQWWSEEEIRDRRRFPDAEAFASPGGVTPSDAQRTALWRFLCRPR